MKIALIGGFGTRVPLVTIGLLRFEQDLHPAELTLWDTNANRQTPIVNLCRALVDRQGSPMRVRAASSAEDAIEGADFILTSIRVGGAHARALDERIALSHGLLGQETVGPGGWAMALRSIPPILSYCRLAERLAPKAWILNFTNPVGIVLQALISAGVRRVIGICDTPREMFVSAAQQLGIEAGSAFFDYFGLNHLGFLRAILVDGVDRLPSLLSDPSKLEHIYHVPLFDPNYLQSVRLLPTEYVYFYLRGDEAAARLQSANQTRGEMIVAQEEELFRKLSASSGDPGGMIGAYDAYLAARNASYFSVETGVAVTRETLERARRELYEKAAGYERIAVDVMRAISRNQPTVFPVDVANHGSLDGFDTEDAVEVPCVIDSNGARPLAGGAIPDAVRGLIFEVKQYERLTAEAALTGSLETAARALAANPLVKTRTDSTALARQYVEAQHPWLDYLEVSSRAAS